MLAALAVRCPRALCGTLRAFSTDTVALSGLAFYARHGVLDAERTLGQKFVVDLHMHVPTSMTSEAAASDDVQDTVDYAAVFEQVRGVVQEGPTRNLIETVAHDVALGVLASQPRVVGVDVTVSKPHVALPVVLDCSSVTVRRRRDDL